MKKMSLPIVIIKDEDGYFFNGGYIPNLEELKKARTLIDEHINLGKEEIDKINKEVDEYHYREQIELNNTKDITKSPNYKDCPGYIYVIECNNFFKIGRSLRPKQRVTKYITENPYETKMIMHYKVNNYKKIENNLINQYQNKKHRGEWFVLNKEDINNIKKYLKTYEESQL